MAWSSADREALKAHVAARAAGAQGRRVQFSDRSVEFDSIDDALTLLALMDSELDAAATTPRPRQYLGYTRSGF